MTRKYTYILLLLAAGMAVLSRISGPFVYGPSHSKRSHRLGIGLMGKDHTDRLGQDVYQGSMTAPRKLPAYDREDTFGPVRFMKISQQEAAKPGTIGPNAKRMIALSKREDDIQPQSPLVYATGIVAYGPNGKILVAQKDDPRIHNTPALHGDELGTVRMKAPKTKLRLDHLPEREANTYMWIDMEKKLKIMKQRREKDFPKINQIETKMRLLLDEDGNPKIDRQIYNDYKRAGGSSNKTHALLMALRIIDERDRYKRRLKRNSEGFENDESTDTSEEYGKIEKENALIQAREDAYAARFGFTDDLTPYAGAYRAKPVEKINMSYERELRPLIRETHAGKGRYSISTKGIKDRLKQQLGLPEWTVPDVKAKIRKSQGIEKVDYIYEKLPSTEADMRRLERGNIKSARTAADYMFPDNNFQDDYVSETVPGGVPTLATERELKSYYNLDDSLVSLASISHPPVEEYTPMLTIKKTMAKSDGIKSKFSSKKSEIRAKNSLRVETEEDRTLRLERRLNLRRGDESMIHSRKNPEIEKSVLSYQSGSHTLQFADALSDDTHVPIDLPDPADYKPKNLVSERKIEKNSGTEYVKLDFDCESRSKYAKVDSDSDGPLDRNVNARKEFTRQMQSTLPSIFPKDESTSEPELGGEEEEKKIPRNFRNWEDIKREPDAQSDLGEFEKQLGVVRNTNPFTGQDIKQMPLKNMQCLSDYKHLAARRTQLKRLEAIKSRKYDRNQDLEGDGLNEREQDEWRTYDRLRRRFQNIQQFRPLQPQEVRRLSRMNFLWNDESIGRKVWVYWWDRNRWTPAVVSQLDRINKLVYVHYDPKWDPPEDYKILPVCDLDAVHLAERHLQRCPFRFRKGETIDDESDGFANPDERVLYARDDPDFIGPISFGERPKETFMPYAQG